jgi:exopolysaccharide biosynthesis predicted pyruvyltransferase EpsI
MPLIYSQAFEPLFSQFDGKRIGYVQLDGNVGDAMITDATLFLLNTFRIPFTWIRPKQVFDKELPEDIDELLVSGGGNLGALYPACYRLRRAALECGLPVTVLPQSFASFDEDLSACKRVYVRETASLAVDPSFQLMPDLALGFDDVNAVQCPRFDLAVFLRADRESVFEDRSESLVDPVTNNNTPLEYVEFASLFEHVVTDRLHFAIAALLAGRRVTLLPNSTGKNRAMYETWLRDLGCQWLPDPGPIRYDRREMAETLWTRLAPAPREGLPWHAVCREVETLEPELLEDERVAFLDDTGRTIARVDSNAFAVWSLCDGERDIADIAATVADVYEEPKEAIAGDVLAAVDALHQAGIVQRERREIVVEMLPDDTRDQWVYRRAAVTHPDRPRTWLWFAVPAEHAPLLAQGADCFVIAMVMQAMSDGLTLRLRNGTVSGGLVENLMRFQEQWREWRPPLALVDIEAEVGAAGSPAYDGTIAAFSGGLDSCHTLFAHNVHADSGLRPIDTVVMVHGFDIPLTDARGFAGAAARAKRIADDAGAALLPVRTNFRGVHPDNTWEDRHATALAAVLAACNRRFSTGVLSSTMNAGFPADWGSDPATDPLLTGRGFTIVHYGYESSRLEKFRALSEWPAAVDNLRVCWKNQHRDENCGRCSKCVIALLSLRCLGLSTACFRNAPDETELAGLIPDKYPGGLNLYDLRELADYARDHDIDTPWARRLTELYVR